MNSPSFSSPNKDVAPQDHLTRRCPLYTCGVSLLSIVHISLVKSQGLGGRIGLLVRLMTYVITLARPFIRLMFFFLFTGLLFLDALILAFGSVVEILFPPSVGLFDEINKIIYSIEILPEKLGHVMNKFPNSINEIPTLDNFLALVASRIEIYLSQPVSTRSESKGEENRKVPVDQKCSDSETPNNHEDESAKFNICLQSSDNMEKSESHSTADDDFCGQGSMHTEAYEVDSPETEKVCRDGKRSWTEYDEENRAENDKEKQIEVVEATIKNTEVELKTEEEDKGLVLEEGETVHKTTGEKNIEELEIEQQKSVKFLESEEQLEIEDDNSEDKLRREEQKSEEKIEKEEQKAEEKVEKEEQKVEENISDKNLEIEEQKSDKLEKDKQKAEKKLEKEQQKSEEQKLENKKLEEQKSDKLEREEHNLGEKKSEEQSKTEVSKTEEQETKELKRKEKVEEGEQQIEVKVTEEGEVGAAIKEEEGESMVKYWDAAEQRGDETEQTRKKVLKDDNKDTEKGRFEGDEGEDEKNGVKKKTDEEERKGKKAVLGNSILELFERSWHKKSPSKK